jgi:hypothetical protein
MADREVEVLVRIDGTDELAGRLWCHRRRGVQSQTFRYAASYLALPGAYELDPRLPLVEGAQQTPAGREIFGAFSDAAPDRWGRRRRAGCRPCSISRRSSAPPSASSTSRKARRTSPRCCGTGRCVLIVDRFDRLRSKRVGYVSALTMLDRPDGEAGSYLEIADVIVRHSPSATEDLREMWRRIAFSVLISNLDDHLRNHGFLRTSTAGWSLSPAFDLNPDPRAGERYLNTAIDFDDTEARVDLLLDVAAGFASRRPCAACGRWSRSSSATRCSTHHRRTPSARALDHR